MRVFRGFSPARTRDLWVFAGVKSTFAVSAYVQVFEMPNQAVWGGVINASCLLPPGKEKRQEEETVYRCRGKKESDGKPESEILIGLRSMLHCGPSFSLYLYLQPLFPTPKPHR